MRNIHDLYSQHRFKSAEAQHYAISRLVTLSRSAIFCAVFPLNIFTSLFSHFLRVFCSSQYFYYMIFSLVAVHRNTYFFLTWKPLPVNRFYGNLVTYWILHCCWFKIYYTYSNLLIFVHVNLTFLFNSINFFRVWSG